jgi:hypothetical protein
MEAKSLAAAARSWRVFLVGFCVSCGLIGSVLVQGGFDSWFYSGTGIVMSSSHGERTALLAFILLNPLPTALCMGVLTGLASLGLGSVVEGSLSLAVIICSVAAWWWGIARIIRNTGRRAGAEA